MLTLSHNTDGSVLYTLDMVQLRSRTSCSSAKHERPGPLPPVLGLKVPQSVWYRRQGAELERVLSTLHNDILDALESAASTQRVVHVDQRKLRHRLRQYLYATSCTSDIKTM